MAAGAIFPGDQYTSGNCILRDEFAQPQCLEVSIFVQKNKDQAVPGPGAPALLYGSETWSIGVREQGRLNSFSTRALRRIMGYRWDNFVPNERLLHETGIGHQVTCMIRKRQLRLFGHVARFPESDPVRRVIPKEVSRDWRRPRGRPPVSWLQRINGHCRDLRLPGRAYAWHSARRDPLGWRQTVTATKRHPGVCSH